MLKKFVQPTLNIIIICLICLNTPKATARNFKNAYISFDMQDNWKCNLEQTEWVCRAEDPQEAKEAVIILTAKEKGPTDTFPIYQSHMNNPINTLSKSGPITSTVTYQSKFLKINDQDWLDGLHRDSEIQNYFTRYLATIKNQIAILVTFSAHKNAYSKHSPNFDKTIRSLRVVATKDLISQPDLGPIGHQNDRLGHGIGSAMPNELFPIDDELESKGKKSIFKNNIFLGFILFLTALLIYIGLKVYQKSKK